MLIKIAVLFSLSLATTAFADPDSSHPGAEKFKAAVQACQDSKYNTAKITLPTPTPGQRPELNDAQKQLLHACAEAGILPKHGRHHPPPPPPANPPPAGG